MADTGTGLSMHSAVGVSTIRSTSTQTGLCEAGVGLGAMKSMLTCMDSLMCLEVRALSVNLGAACNKKTIVNQ